MPILNPADAREVEDCFKSLFVAAPQDRAREIRKLFVEVLDFEAVTGQVSLAGAPQGVTLPASAERIAQLDGVHVLYIDLNTVDTDRVRRAEVEAAAKSIRDVLGDDMLLVVINKSGTQLHIIHPDFSGARLVLRRMVVGRDVPRRTVVQQVSNIYESTYKSGNLRAVLSKAFDVEEVTDKFFKKYHEIFDDALKASPGLAATTMTPSASSCRRCSTASCSSTSFHARAGSQSMTTRTTCAPSGLTTETRLPPPRPESRRTSTAIACASSSLPASTTPTRATYPGAHRRSSAAFLSLMVACSPRANMTRRTPPSWCRTA